MDQTLNCPNCSRPLQRNRDACIYCGYRLSEQEINKLYEMIDEETVKKRLQEAEAMLEGTLPKPLSGKGKLIAKAVVTTLSIAMMVFISWIAEWNPVFIGLSVVFFAIPIWHVFRKLG